MVDDEIKSGESTRKSISEPFRPDGFALFDRECKCDGWLGTIEINGFNTLYNNVQLGSDPFCTFLFIGPNEKAWFYRPNE